MQNRFERGLQVGKILKGKVYFLLCSLFVLGSYGTIPRLLGMIYQPSNSTFDSQRLVDCLGDRVESFLSLGWKVFRPWDGKFSIPGTESFPSCLPDTSVFQIYRS